MLYNFRTASVRYMLDMIRRKCQLPKDPYGQTLPVADMVKWFGLDSVLDERELEYVKRELAQTSEAEAVMGRLWR